LTECTTSTHAWFQFTAGLVVIFIAFGVPAGFTVALVLKARAFDQMDDSRIAGTVAAQMGMSPAAATDVIREVTIGKDYGFLLRAYGPRHYWFENFDMVRKLLLVGVLVVVGRGSAAQVGCAACLSVGFIMLQFKLWPYKLSADNTFKAVIEAQIFATVLVALLLKTDLTTEAVGASFYDVMLVTLFAINVVGGFVCTVAAKLFHAHRLLGLHNKNATEEESRKHALALHRAGLARKGTRRSSSHTSPHCGCWTCPRWPRRSRAATATSPAAFLAATSMKPRRRSWLWSRSAGQRSTARTARGAGLTQRPRITTPMQAIASPKPCQHRKLYQRLA
jgi:hypothetical protein